MKTLLKCSTLLLIAASPYVAAQDNTLLINTQALTLTLKDNNQAQVSSQKPACAGYFIQIILRGFLNR